jgi:hypothetical protein
MQKIKSYEQFIGEILCMLVCTSPICGMALCHAAKTFGIGMLQIAGTACYAITFILLLFSVVFWLLRNQLEGGIIYAFHHDRLVRRIRSQLLDAGIYTIIKFGAIKLAKLPWITVNFASDYKSGTIYIQNSIKHHDKLSKIDISPSLGRYVVEQVYLTDTENHYRYDFYDSSLERRLVFDSLDTFKAYSAQMGQYELFIDCFTELALTHQLIVGCTGTGKSYALYNYLLQMVLKPIKYHLYFADPKESGIALLGEHISPDATSTDYDGIVSLLENFVDEMHKRQIEMKKHLSKKLDGDYRDFGLSPHILIFDEFADFSLLLQTKEKKQRDYINNLISQIVLKGRQAGFFLWIVMQQAGSNNIPTYVRDNLPCKVVLGNAEDQTYVTAYGAGADIPLRKMRLGDGVYTYPTVANKPKLCSFPTFEFDILQELEAGVM